MSRRFLILIFGFVLITCNFAWIGYCSANAAIDDKITPWVMAHTDEGLKSEALIVLKPQAELNGSGQFKTRREKGRFVYESLVEKARASQGPIIKWLQERGIEYRSFYIVNAIWIKADRKILLDLAQRSDITRIEGNPAIRMLPDLPEAAPLSTDQVDGIEANISYVHAPQVWALGYTGQGIVVGGQDTGYQWDHPALKNQYRGWDGSAAGHDYNWHDAVHTNTHGANLCGADSAAPCDDNGHGTHTMGTAVGNDGGTNQIGMAPDAKWIGCRCMDNGWGTPQSYLECFEFFLAPYPIGGDPMTDGDPDKAPDVTINSWRCPPNEGCTDVTVLQAAVEAQFAAGILTVSSAGNSGYSVCSTVTDPPAIYAKTYTVGSLIIGTDTLTYSSSLGPVTIDGSGRRKPDITAPGSNIRSSIRGSTYGYMGGTSMAAPHAAGAAALLWSAVPELKNDPAATMQRLNFAAHHLDSSSCGCTGWPNNTFGYGRLDVLAALNGPGDVNGDRHIDLHDAITALQIMSESSATSGVLTADINADSRIGLAEAIYVLQWVAGLQSE